MIHHLRKSHGRRHDGEGPHGHKPRWRRRAEARPDDILDAARGCFLEDGYSGATMERIARRAGLSKGAVYLYFESKEAMLLALIQRSVKPLAEAAAARLDADSAPADPAAALAEGARAMRGLLADPDMFAAPRIVLAESARFPELADIYRREVMDIVLPAAKRLIERGKAQGTFRDVDPYVAARSLAGGVLIQALWQAVFARDGETAPDPDAYIAAHLDIVLNGLCAEAAP